MRWYSQFLVDDAEKAERWARRLAWSGTIIAFVAGSCGFFRLIQTVAPIFTVVAIALAFVSGVCGLAARFLEHRKKTLDSHARRAIPCLDASIKTFENQDRKVVVIECKTNTPFRYEFKICTKDNIVISPLMMGWATLYPKTLKKNTALIASDTDMNRAKDGYVELRFRYRSIYYEEINDPNLAGEITKQYVLSPDRRYCLPIA